MPMPSHYRPGSDMPYTKILTITPHDSNALDPIPRGILVTVAGNLTLRLEEDTADQVIPVNANTIYPISPKLIKATGTTATGIKGFY